MEVKKNRLNADFDKIPEAVERIFRNKRIARNKRRFHDKQPLLFRTAISLASAVIIMMYFLFPTSSVRAVSIEGTTYLTDEYILSVAGVDTHSKLYLTVPVLVERKLEVNPLIASADVHINRGNTVSIEVQEKKIVGYQTDDQQIILLADGTSVPITQDNQQIISTLPKLIGFQDTELLKKAVSSLGEITENILQQISSVSVYPLRYDPNGLLVQMRTGGYYVGTYSNLIVLNDYFEIYSRIPDKTYCLWGTNKNQVAFSSPCPWNIEKESVEYWLDAEGNTLLNKNGSAIEKHYYTDAAGNPAQDDQGQPIAIPIDADGIEVIDPDFLANYEAGYYSSGILVIPTPSQ